MDNPNLLNRLIQFYQDVRQTTESLCSGLSAEDMTVQSMPDCSPTKWHLAHTTWFFENFILRAHLPHYPVFNSRYHYLFNSYYESEGERHARPNRGLLTRPSLQEILDYRRHVDDYMARLFDSATFDRSKFNLLVTGLHHEMQHQELLLTDLLHLLSCNPLLPIVRETTAFSVSEKPSSREEFFSCDGGLVTVGATPLEAQWDQFHYDNEAPQHKVWLEPYKMQSRPVTNQDWLSFMNDGGYKNPLLWLADGWTCCQKNNWTAPGYWQHTDTGWQQYGLRGLLPLDPHAPVCHISYYEADAFARWAGARLPSEFEWELASHQAPVTENTEANFLESALWHPRAGKSSANGPSQLFGDVWEWTASPYSPYPGYKPKQGALGEYNGKFMANQWVLRGGSCVTPRKQIRHTYRNFFYPHQRWQFTGARLATES